MGTRGFLGVKKDGSFKVAQYNQFDTYLSGLGSDVVQFIVETTKSNTWDKFTKNLSKIRLVDENYVPTNEEIDANKEFANVSVSTGRLTEPYVLLRELQGVRVLWQILSGRVSLLENQSDFINNSSCEYSYIIDLDDRTLEIRQGQDVLGVLSFSSLVESFDIDKDKWMEPFVSTIWDKI